MSTILNIGQMIISVGIIGLVLLTVRSSGFSPGQTSTQQSRRGPEKIAFYALIVLVIIFAALSIARLYFA